MANSQKQNVPQTYHNARFNGLLLQRILAKLTFLSLMRQATNPTDNLHVRALAMVFIYAVLKFFGGSFGQMALYPVTLLVTFLHEFGHALGGILTGGKVLELRVAPDGSGHTLTQGGSAGVILMGGYLGSALLGNLLFYIGARRRSWAQTTLLVLAVVMALTGVLWFESFTSSAILFGFAALMYFIARKTDWEQDVLMFLGLAAVLYIIQDFNVGPKSDLARYEEVVGVFSAQIWTYIWLGLAGLLFYANLKEIFRWR